MVCLMWLIVPLAMVAIVNFTLRICTQQRLPLDLHVTWRAPDCPGISCCVVTDYRSPGSATVFGGKMGFGHLFLPDRLPDARGDASAKPDRCSPSSNALNDILKLQSIEN